MESVSYFVKVEELSWDGSVSSGVKKKLGEMHHVCNFTVLIVLPPEPWLYSGKVGSPKMTPFIWKPDALLSSGISAIFPHANLKSNTILLAS